MPRYKLICQYDGSNFSGWQSQKSTRTVQDELERVLTLLNHGDLVRIVGSGRTDAGVHALGQVAHIYLPSNHSLTSKHPFTLFLHLILF